jgi:predicted CDP-diglyceride synthetase/phosphatidate cytidylyltransferase
LPRFNPFDALYNLMFGSRPGNIRLEPAPAPRRFAQGMAGTFAMAIGVMLSMHWFTAAYILEALLAAAILSLIFGRFCLGSFIYHLLRGNVKFALNTLPWARHRMS